MRACKAANGNMIRIGFIAAVLSAAAACAAPGDKAVDLSSDPRLGAEEDIVCFTGRLNGFYGVSDRALVLRRAPGEAYLVRTGFCPNLKAIEGLRLERRDNCLVRGDRLSVFDTRLPQQDEASDAPDRCLITAIHHWAEREQEQ